MKYITLLRHAAAVHDSSISDYNRPLRRKGLEKAGVMAEQLSAHGYIPDLIISSPAERAIQTAEIYVAESGCGLALVDIHQIENLYLPSPGDILDNLKAIDEKYSDVFLFSHNNGISWAAQQLSSDKSILMPTGSAVRIELNIRLWRDVVFGCGKKINFLL